MTTYNQTATGGALSGGTGLPNDPCVVITNVSALDPVSYLVQFRSQRVPPVTFRIIVAGVEVYDVPSTASGTGKAILTIGSGDSPFFEILDDPNQKPHPAYNGHLSLNWRLLAGSQNYAVQEYLSGSWTTEASIAEDGTNNHIYLTRWLEDSETHQFQVLPVDANGNAGTPISYESEMVRHPDNPSVAIAYNGSSTPTLTITEV
jgi:hypothetical protein